MEISASRRLRFPLSHAALIAAVLASACSGPTAATSAPTSPTARPSATKPIPFRVPEGDLAEQPTGRIAFGRGDDIYVANVDGTGLHRLTTRPGPEFDPSWSPDGRRIAYRDSRRGINHNDEIYVMRSNGSGQTNLTRNPADDWGPAWSPDGKTIAFNSARNGKPQIFLMAPDGSHVRLVAEREGEYPAWSPDGRRIAFMSQQPDASGTDPNYDVFVIDVDGSGERQLTDFPGEDGWPAWSSTGLIAFQTSVDDVGQSGDIGPYFDIYVMNPDGSSRRRVTEVFAEQPVWSRDGRLLMFVGGPVPLTTTHIYVANSDGSGLTALPLDGSIVDWTSTAG